MNEPAPEGFRGKVTPEAIELELHGTHAVGLARLWWIGLLILFTYGVLAFGMLYDNGLTTESVGFLVFFALVLAFPVAVVVGANQQQAIGPRGSV